MKKVSAYNSEITEMQVLAVGSKVKQYSGTARAKSINTTLPVIPTVATYL
jgi:hypothetical protein